ncbi:DUF2919 domain-containing protein [Paraglaciecola hydrolytica]|uniref:DUF2919 domain-containing protein n=1 Tax=Paraglaciecola hydrolytica TaxID=1799789 RepID=A0A136A5Z5_9ALTE|nr:DUF2919 domain-containing protein [Paraglaciecola hydrolytica]KXI30634.1 hypothetical protein AX660_04150 [Paraglaciecola hydrolytica]
MTKLLLDLKHYDEAGRVKPSSALLLLMVFLCRSLLILVMALAAGQDSNALLRLFYPEEKYLYIGLAIALPAFISYVLIAFREKLSKTQLYWPFHLIKYFLFFACLLDFIYQCYLANLHYWQFSWAIATILILDMWFAYFVLKDRHLKVFVADWLQGR